jgi:hypothetical protein
MAKPKAKKDEPVDAAAEPTSDVVMEDDAPTSHQPEDDNMEVDPEENGEEDEEEGEEGYEEEEEEEKQRVRLVSSSLSVSITAPQKDRKF